MKSYKIYLEKQGKPFEPKEIPMVESDKITMQKTGKIDILRKITHLTTELGDIFLDFKGLNPRSKR